ncbi:TAXI family TRAP transporter solute-binding subunit [Rhodopseudomonas sp. NSM]|uniref:TAXI family TRAP transporter solute-binding subunit n=1 Tax=Rhodopseudomonas sp. NSM TaxID=3457630 RepID=UPI0040355AAD
MASADGSGESLRKRRQRNRTRLRLATVLTVVLLGVGALGVVAYQLRPETLRIAVGPQGSDDLKLIQALAQSFVRDRSAVRLTPVVTDGATPSIEAWRQGRADLAVTRGDLDLPADAQAVAILRKNVVTLWSAPGKGKKAGTVKSIADLAGRKVGVIGRTPANVKLLHVILAESGVAPDRVQTEQFATTAIADMARDESLAAYFALGPLDSKTTAEAIAATAKARGEPRFLPVDVADSISKKYPIYDSEEIPGSTFSAAPARPEDKVDTVSVNHLIIAKSALSSLDIAQLTRQIFAARQQLARELPIAGKIEAPDTDKAAALPAHSGAAAFIDGTERTFMERNSDYIWGLVVLLSGLGSAGAWFRSYVTRDERAAGARMRDRALALVAKARKAHSLDELDAMQHEIDRILRDMLECYDDGAIDDLAPFDLVLEQFHHAVADRRKTLTMPSGGIAPAHPDAFGVPGA